MTSPMRLGSWPSSHGAISEEAVRRLHWPNYRHRFSAQKYPPGTEFSGTQCASTCYVLNGACVFTFSGESINIEGEQLAALPAGDFSFRIVGQNEVLLVCVFELPFDDVHRRRDGIEYLEDHGIHASARDWALGETIFAYQLPEEHRGITVWKNALCVAPEVDGWFVEDVANPRAERQSFSDLKSACDYVLAAWLKPDWRRLHRDAAKLLLARSRQVSLSEARKQEILDEYRVYETGADVAEAIRAGDLPELDEVAVALLAAKDRPQQFPGSLDPLLDDWLLHELKCALNSYLREELRVLGHEVIVEGQMEQGGVCPCCEYLAIDFGEDGMWDICPVCFWENGGEGPNHLSLADAKRNFEELGACDQHALEHLAPDRRRKYRRVWQLVDGSDADAPCKA